jgi:acetolactate synthase-1/2/3 large subunit
MDTTMPDTSPNAANREIQQGRSGAELIVKALALHGADIVFGVPGESYLGVLDSMLDEPQLRFITCRQEGGAAFMAEAYGKLTGRPGICMVTRGPGACNAAIGLHTAYQDSTPMILFVGQVGLKVCEREAFQEIDYRRMFGPVAKWVAQIDRADRIAEYISRAFHTATAGRAGPVVLVLPEDMQDELAPPASARRYQPVSANPSPADLATMRRLVAEAQRPLLVLGGSRWSAAGVADLERFAANFGLPVASAFRRQDLFDNGSPHYIGDLSPGMNPALAEKVKTADLLIAVGSRLTELSTMNYTLIDIPRPKQRLIHVHPDPEELGRVYQADLHINSGLVEFAAAAAALEPLTSPRNDWLADGRRSYGAWQEPQPQPGALNLSEAMVHLRNRLPKDAILANGAGNYAIWVHRFMRYAEFHTQLSPTSGAMGYGVPAAVAAKLVEPERPVVCFAGDGCFMMNGQELATAAQYGLKILFIVINNGMYGTIRMHQEREFPGRVSGTSLVNPDFTTLARAYGFHAASISTTAEFPDALEAALAAPRSAVLELKLDPDALSPRVTVSGLRAAKDRR